MRCPFSNDINIFLKLKTLNREETNRITDYLISVSGGITIFNKIGCRSSLSKTNNFVLHFAGWLNIFFPVMFKGFFSKI